MGDRPASHIFAGLCFFLFASGYIFTGYNMLQASQGGYLGMFLYAVPYVIALGALLTTRAKWSYFLAAFLLGALPVFLIGSMLLVLYRVETATFGSISPSFLVSGPLLWLFYAFTFGNSSKAFYGVGLGK